MLAPSSKATEEDAFNFHHSSLYMHIEQAFGMLIAKWPLLKSLKYGVEESMEVVSVAMKMFHFCVDHREVANDEKVGVSQEEKKLIDDCRKWYAVGNQRNVPQFGNGVIAPPRSASRSSLLLRMWFQTTSDS